MLWGHSNMVSWRALPPAQIKKSVAAGSAAKEAEKKVATSGLDAMLAAIQGAKKVGVERCL